MASKGFRKGNNIIIKDNYAEIELRDQWGTVIAKALIDIEDIPIVSNFTWFCNLGYARAALNRKMIHLHRLIMNPKEDEVVDHISRDPLDNRKCNLRVCKQIDNMKNRSLPKNNSSGYQGVNYYKNYGKWRAAIGINGSKLVLGFFDNMEEAVKARKEAEIKYYEKFRGE